MSQLIVMAFDNLDTAKTVRDKLTEMQKAELIKLKDAAIAVRNEEGKVNIKQVANLAGAGALGGAFWGFLIGLIFWMPFLGLAIGAITGAISGSLADYGVNDDFIREVGQTIQPGQAALFLLVEQATFDRISTEINQYNPRIIRTNLSAEQEANLRETFGEEPAMA